jgi:protein-S-isoprenylcysteine O-methyltransferase Ste14
MNDTIVPVAEQPAHILNNSACGRAATGGQVETTSASVSLPAPVHEIIIRFGHVMFRFRNVLFPLTLMLLVLTSTPQLPFGSARLDRWFDAVGVILALLGQTCRALAIGSVDNIRRGGQRKRIAANTLIRSGFYAHTRNPLYFGNLIILSGLLLIANCRWWYVLVWPGFLGIYYAIVCAEEEFLSWKFGQAYRDYLQTVNRFLPTFTGLHQSLAHSSFAWRRVFRKEFGVFCSWLSSAFLLLLWEQWERGGDGLLEMRLPYLLFFLLTLLGLMRGMVWLRRSSTRKGV